MKKKTALTVRATHFVRRLNQRQKHTQNIFKKIFALSNIRTQYTPRHVLAVVQFVAHSKRTNFAPSFLFTTLPHQSSPQTPGDPLMGYCCGPEPRTTSSIVDSEHLLSTSHVWARDSCEGGV